MDNFENLSQEELLEAAQKAYEEQAGQNPSNNPPLFQEEPEEPTLDKPIKREEEPVLDDELHQEEEQQEISSLPTGISTNGTAIGIATGLVLGAGVGFLTGKVAACLTIGVLLGVLIGLFIDVKKDKKAAVPKKEEVPATTILEDTIQEEE